MEMTYSEIVAAVWLVATGVPRTRGFSILVRENLLVRANPSGGSPSSAWRRGSPPALAHALTAAMRSFISARGAASVSALRCSVASQPCLCKYLPCSYISSMASISEAPCKLKRRGSKRGRGVELTFWINNINSRERAGDRQLVKLWAGQSRPKYASLRDSGRVSWARGFRGLPTASPDSNLWKGLPLVPPMMVAWPTCHSLIAGQQPRLSLSLYHFNRSQPDGTRSGQSMPLLVTT